MSTKRRIRSRAWVWLLAGAVCSAGASGGGPPEHVNQITGTLRLTNENPVILEALNGSARAYVGAATYDELEFRNLVMMEPLDTTEFSYSIDVAATTQGVVYSVSGQMALILSPGSPTASSYVFRDSESPPVFPEPAPDVVVGFEECMGMIDVNWLDANGDPIVWSLNKITAFPEEDGGGFSYLAQAQTEAQTLLVRGDGTLYRVEMIRTDPVDLTRLGCTQTARVNCDEIVQVDCHLPDPGEPASLAGVVDMIGKDELQIPYGTTVGAQGPFGNYGIHEFNVTPSSGPFLIDGLMASPVSTPPTPYSIYVSLTVPAGESLERFQAPFESVLLDPGEAGDLGDAFVMRPGYMIGQIELIGPPDPGGGSCLADLQLLDDTDEDGDGIPDAYYRNFSAVRASGDSVPAPGATRSAAGGYALAGFLGTLDESTNTFRADYEMALAGLFSEPSLWWPRGLQLGFVDLSGPAASTWRQYSTISVSGRSDVQQVAPRQTTTIDYRYCLGQVSLQVWSEEPDQTSLVDVLGYLPDAPYDATYSVGGIGIGDLVCALGEDCQEGTPGQYSFDLCLPAGSYRLHPLFRSWFTGDVSYRIPLTLEVGCRQSMSLSADLGVELAPIQECAVGDAIGLSGSAYSTFEVQRIYYRLNGGPEVDLCTDCGEDPSFQSQVPDAACANRIDVIAVDANGSEASLSAAFDCLVELDTDTDGVVDCSDCAPGDAGAWSMPGEVSDLMLSHSNATGLTSLSWDALEDPGAVSVSYVVRTQTHEACFDSDLGTATSMTDAQTPSPGAVLQFLVAAANSCGSGSFGEDSTGGVRPPCP